MFAVIETGGKQYRVSEGQILEVELAPVEVESKGKGKQAKEHRKVSFDRVLMIYGDGGTRVGNPVIPGARVEAEPIDEVRGPKVLIFKHKRRKGYKRRGGHRQDYLRVRVAKILV